MIDLKIIHFRQGRRRNCAYFYGERVRDCANQRGLLLRRNNQASYAHEECCMLVDMVKDPRVHSVSVTQTRTGHWDWATLAGRQIIGNQVDMARQGEVVVGNTLLSIASGGSWPLLLIR